MSTRLNPWEKVRGLGVRLVYGQMDMWLTERQSWNQTSVQYSAILHGWMAELQTAYLKECHNLSKEKQPETRRRSKQNINDRKISCEAQTKSWAVQWKQLHQNRNSRKGMFGDVNKDTCCLTGSTWQPLPCGISAISCARQTAGKQTTLCSG